jgi:hypothetical protein
MFKTPCGDFNKPDTLPELKTSGPIESIDRLRTSPATTCVGGGGVAGPGINIPGYGNPLYVYEKYVKKAAGTGREPDEYRFKYYFTSKDGDVHMPYMRWWDTGVSAGNVKTGGNPVNMLGMHDVLIGVGREERDEENGYWDAYEADYYSDSERKSRLKKTASAQAGRVGGWTELVAHQMQTERRYNMACLGRYEKLFKVGSAENFVLSKAGSGFTTREGKQWPWSLGWRGYVTSTLAPFPNEFATATAKLAIVPNSDDPDGPHGLDNALEGDIIIVSLNGLPQIYYVTGIGYDPKKSGWGDIAFDFKSGKHGGMIPDRIYAIGWDQGKFPTSTGVSINWGIGKERTIYREKLPETARDVVKKTKGLMALTNAYTKEPIEAEKDCGGPASLKKDFSYQNCEPSCEDQDLEACVLPTMPYGPQNYSVWKNAIVYRPNLDVRECSGTPTIDGKPPEKEEYSKVTMKDTYEWIKLIGASIEGKGMPKASDKVIYPSMSGIFDTHLWSKCVNQGFDPPAHWSREYKGPSTGALTDNTLCGPMWGECSAKVSAKEHCYYPRGWRIFKDKTDPKAP